MFRKTRIRPGLVNAVVAVFLIAFGLSTPRSVSADSGGGGSTVNPDTISYDQNVNAQLPLNVSLTDETGRTVQLRQYFGAKPVILIFAYYNCTMLCNLALSDLAQNLKNLKASAGTDFQVLTISFNAQETPHLAAKKKAAYMQIYDRPEAAQGWHFLVAKQDTIDRLTKTAGFHYAYDPATQEFAHPTGVIVLSPGGKIRRYIFGINYNATDLRLALLDATNQKAASPIDQVFLLCYHYNPVTGKYDIAINNIIRIAGIGSAVLLAGFVLWLHKRTEKKSTFRGVDTHAHGH